MLDPVLTRNLLTHFLFSDLPQCNEEDPLPSKASWFVPPPAEYSAHHFGAAAPSRDGRGRKERIGPFVSNQGVAKTVLLPL